MDDLYNDACFFWNSDDPETSYDDPDDIVEICDIGCVAVIEVAQRLPNIYGVRMPDDTFKYFTTLAEAKQMLQEKKP